MLKRYATWANEEGRSYTNVLIDDGPAPRTFVAKDGEALTLRCVTTVEFTDAPDAPTVTTRGELRALVVTAVAS